jgi:hypothetical protein
LQILRSKRSDYAISAGLAQPAIAASKISEFFEVTQHPTAEWLARQITILDLAAGDVDHELGEDGVAGAFVGLGLETAITQKISPGRTSSHSRYSSVACPATVI